MRYFTTNAYNLYGSLSSVTDELGHATVYGRDEYQRIITVTNPLSQKTTNSYLPWSKTSSYLTTSNFVFSTTVPSLKKVYNYCDNEFRKTQVTQAPGTADQAVSYFTYDATGNQKTAKNPRGNQTTSTYDQRDRLISVLRPLSQTTSYAYDQASNKIKETRPDGKFRTWDTFDAMNRVKHMTGFLSDSTSYLYNFAGKMTQMTDSKGAIYGFGYDLMNRKSSATYPADSGGVVRTEARSYDANGNLALYTNPAGQLQAFTYDNRDRQIGSNWNAVGPDLQTAYDAASRVLSVTTADGSTVAYGYDNANRQISEDQTLTGFPLRHISTPVDTDGNRTSLSLPGFYSVLYQYTQRQHMSLIGDSSGRAYYAFSYDLNGNLTKEQDKVQGLDSTNFSYDALDRVTLCQQTGASDVSFATSHYDYDLNNNIQDTYRDEQAGKGERFGYDPANQLISALYNADGVTTPNPSNPDRTVAYTLDPLNRLSLQDNGKVTDYTANGLNQYTTVSPKHPTYDDNFSLQRNDGWTYSYDAARRLIDASNNNTGQSVQFAYDGLNRCVKRTTDGVTKVFTYDGWKPVVEWDGAGAFVAWNIYGPGPDQILMRYAASSSYLHYHADQFGNVKFLLDSANAGIEKYTYDAFGAPAITDWAGNPRTDSAYGNRFMFTGREYLSTIGIYDYRNRMYSPLLGRFLQTDPSGFDADDNNLYRYLGHNPANGTDPSGLFSLTGLFDKVIRIFSNNGIFGAPGSTSTAYGAPSTGSNIPDTQERTYLPGGGYDQVDHSVANGYTDRGSFTADGTSILRATAVDGGGGIGDFLGKIWALPNTVIGTVIGLASLPFGGHADLGYNGIVFSNLPFGNGALTLGNTILTNSSFADLSQNIPTYYARQYGDAAAMDLNGCTRTNYGWHEGAHIFQYQLLGPLYLPVYLLTHPFSASSPFENAADQYGAGQGNWVPGG